jgi:peptidyl-dipeptidase Dcp
MQTQTGYAQNKSVKMTNPLLQKNVKSGANFNLIKTNILNLLLNISLKVHDQEIDKIIIILQTYFQKYSFGIRDKVE